MSCRSIIKTILLLLAVVTTFSSVVAQRIQCRQGFEWTISQALPWGVANPIITSVQPYSPADLAGLRVGDIIERIDGKVLDGLTIQQVRQILQSDKAEHLLTITNFSGSGQKRLLGRACKPTGSLSERDLAELFSLYSLEDASLQMVDYPFVYKQSPESDLTKVHTFGFAPSSTATEATDRIVNAEIARVLKAKGLREESKNPDLVIRTSYSLTPTGRSSIDEMQIPFSWRYDPSARDLKPLPIITMHSTGVWPAYQLQFGIQIQQSGVRGDAWTVDASERLSSDMTIADYARYTIEPMLTGFPAVISNSYTRLAVRTLRYYYTGIVYDRKNLSLVADVAEGSPAMKAGVRPGDVILSINGIVLDRSRTEELLDSYYNLAERTDRYRDATLPPLSLLVGNLTARYWRVEDYERIADLISRNRSDAAFAYLFAFRPYINPYDDGRVVLEIARSGRSYSVMIVPERRDESTITPQ